MFRKIVKSGMLMLLGTAVFLSPAAQADANGGHQPRIFVEEPGVLEFSGRMIARPVRGQVVKADLAKQQLEASYTIIRYREALNWYVIKVPEGQDENSVAQNLMSTRLFEFVEPDWTCYPSVVPNDPQFGNQWHLTKIQATSAWNYNTGFNGITVGICDTGLRVTHNDLPGLRKEGYNAVDEIWENSGGNITDIHGHGTHVTGIAAAAGNNGIGVCGVGWNYAHRILKVSNNINGTSSIDILTHAAVTSSEQGDRAINVSYSGVDNAAVRAAATTVKGNGGLLFWAAGNSGQNLSGSNRDSDDVMVIGSSTESDGRSSFSNYGLYVDLFAPGSNILSLSFSGDNAYTTKSGTSMASPCAAGLAALIWSQNPAFTPDDIEDLMKGTCDNIGNSNTFGYGRINASKAMVRTQRRSLGTIWNGGNSQNGAMFDVTCLSPAGITITAFDFNDRSGGPADLEVYYVTNKTSYVGKEQSGGLWTLLGSVSGITPKPEGEPTPLNVGNLTIEPGQTVGIYITRTDGNYIRYTNGPLGAFQTPDLRIENRGVGKVYPFADTYANRVWNGAVHYRLNLGGILPTGDHATYNFIPFANGDTCTMHQVFDHNLFNGRVTMESIGFAPNTALIGDTSTSNITIRMGYTNKIPGQDTGSGGLDSNLGNNPSGAMTTLYSGTGVVRTYMTNGTIEHSMFFDFGRNSFTYDPSQGNLLVEIASSNNSGVDVSVSRAAGSRQASRAFNSTRYGNSASPTTATRMDLGYRDAAPPPFTLTATGVCPGRVTVTWEGATPSSTVALIYAKNTGSFVIPFGPCEGTVLGLGSRSIRLVSTFPSGSNGSGSRSGNSQAGACLGYMQMHDLPGCNLTNVVQHP